MNRENLIKLHRDTCEKCLKIMEQKNQDYAGGTGDPFSNFRASEVLGIPAELGILMRSMDKFKRIQTFVKDGSLAVKNESVFDSIEDVINYMVLLKGLIMSRQLAASPPQFGNAMLSPAMKRELAREMPKSIHHEAELRASVEQIIPPHL